MVVKGRVVHSSVRHLHRDRVFYRTGVEFIDLTEPATRAITDVVDALSSRNAASVSADPDAGA